VVQEFVLARNVQLVLANTVVPLELFQIALGIMNDMIRVPGFVPDILYRPKDWLSRLISAVTHIHQLFAYREVRLSQSDLDETQHDVSLAFCIAYLASGRLCEDPRDRLYAMLAMANDDLGIQPDYTVSVATLANNFAIRSLLNGELLVLHMGGIRYDKEAGNSSFAPDLSTRSLATRPLNHPELGFSASTGNPTKIESINDHTIKIAGVPVGAITDCFNDTLIKIWGDIYNPLGGFYPNRDLAIWKSRIARESLVTYNLSSWFDVFPWLVKLEVISPLFKSGTERPHEISLQYLNNRYVFQTQQGYLGIGPMGMKPDDQVVIFDGGATPFIIRKMRTEEGGSSDKWQLVGDCYLLGWMDGNFFGHTVVDELPSSSTCDSPAAGNDDAKYLVRESFVLC
jgi:hypothetical protein